VEILALWTRSETIGSAGKYVLRIQDAYNRAAIFAAVTDPIGFGFEPLEVAMPDAVCSETLRTAVVCQFRLFNGQVTAGAAQFCCLGWEQDQFLVFAL
jgi:hypothetical protein